MGKSIGFKKIVFFFCFILILINGTYGQKTLPVYDGINYTAGTLAYDNVNWWCLNTSPVNDITVSSGSLSYTGLLGPTGNKLGISGDGDDIVIWFGDQPANTKIYYSFIFQVTDLTVISTGTSAHFAGFSNSNTTAGSFGCSIFIRKDATDPAKFNIGHSPRSSVVPVWNLSGGVPVQYSINTPILIVADYEIIGTFLSGTPNDKSSLWINPSSATFENALPPTATLTGDLTGTGINDINPLNTFYIRQDAPTNTPSMNIDEIRIGSTWASVTPKEITTGTKKLLNDKITASVYPNPVNDQLNVDIKSADINSIEIYNLTGIRLLTKKIDQGTTSIDVSALPKGTYTVLFKGRGVMVNRKFIKK